MWKTSSSKKKDIRHLVLVLYCCCGENVNYGLLSRHLKQQHGAWKKP